MRIISAPFGNYLHRPGWVRTIGTFTPQYRGSFWYRVWRCLRTLRYDRRYAGWVNKLGLPNPGQPRLAGYRQHGSMAGTILSLGVAHDDTPDDWRRLLETANQLSPLAWEINASCPNESRGFGIRELFVRAVCRAGGTQIYVKLPPIHFESIVEEAVKVGISKFHCCNTYPTEQGSLSGPYLRPYVRLALDFCRRQVPNCELIAGGGIQCAADAQDYYDCGAHHVAVGSAWFNPVNWSALSHVADISQQ